MNDLSPSSSSASGYFWIILTAFFWSLVGVLSKVCMAEGVTPLETAFWRAAFGLLFFLGHTLFTRQIAVPPRVAANFILFGVWGIGVFYSVTQYAIKLSGAAMAVVLMHIAPIWVAVISRFLFGETISGRKLGAIGVALCGTALVCFSGGSLPGQHSWVGIACGIIIGMSYASHYPFYRWWQDRYSTATIYFYSLVGASWPCIWCLPSISAIRRMSGSASPCWAPARAISPTCATGWPSSASASCGRR